MGKGIIYVMTAKAVDGLVKIGKTGSSNFESRMWNIEKDGYCHQVLERKFAIEVDDYDEKEKLLQLIFAKSRIGNSELFALDDELVVQLMSSFKGKVIYPINKTQENIFNDATKGVEEKIKYNEDYYFNRMTPITKKLYVKLNDLILHNFPDLYKNYTQNYISYKKGDEVVVCIGDITKTDLKLYLNLHINELKQDKNICEDCANKGKWGIGDTRIKISNETNFKYLVKLIKQVYDKK